MPYTIIATTPTYAPAKNKRTLVKLDNGRACIFDTLKDARIWLGVCNSIRQPWRFNYGESGLPQYKIAPLHSLPAYLKIQL